MACIGSRVQIPFGPLIFFNFNNKFFIWTSLFFDISLIFCSGIEIFVWIAAFNALICTSKLESEINFKIISEIFSAFKYPKAPIAQDLTLSCLSFTILIISGIASLSFLLANTRDVKPLIFLFVELRFLIKIFEISFWFNRSALKASPLTCMLSSFNL